MNEKLEKYLLEHSQTITQYLYKNYTMEDLLEAVLLYEVKFKLRDNYELDKKTIEENYEKLANIIFKEIDIFNHDEIDKTIDEYLKLKNLKKEGKRK